MRPRTFDEACLNALAGWTFSVSLLSRARVQEVTVLLLCLPGALTLRGGVAPEAMTPERAINFRLEDEVAATDCFRARL